MSMVFEEQGLTIGEAQRYAAASLREAGIENSGLDARVLLAGLLRMEMAGLLASSGQPISKEDYQVFCTMVEERKVGKPVHRILGYREFFGRKFEFGEDCLEPRPETELLVERVLQDYDPSDAISFGEIGVGSGVICCSLLAELPKANAVGTDIAAGALKATGDNAKTFGVQERLRLEQADCLEGIENEFDFIVSNPPYIATSKIEELEKDVRLFDPAAALDGGRDGLEVYEKIFRQAGDRLKPGGRLYLETGHGQHHELELLAGEMGWGIVSTHLDLSGLERIVVLADHRISQQDRKIGLNN